jgi:hypothetical protein
MGFGADGRSASNSGKSPPLAGRRQLGPLGVKAGLAAALGVRPGTAKDWAQGRMQWFDANHGAFDDLLVLIEPPPRGCGPHGTN